MSSPTPAPEALSDKSNVFNAVESSDLDYPSWKEFYDIHSLSLPSSLLEATIRLKLNISHFKVNYLLLLLNISYFYIGFTVAPVNVAIGMLVIIMACWSVYDYCIRIRRESSNIPKVLVFNLVWFVTLIGYLYPWVYTVVLLVVFVTVVCLHGMLRVPIYDDSRYQSLLDAQPQPQPQPKLHA